MSNNLEIDEINCSSSEAPVKNTSCSIGISDFQEKLQRLIFELSAKTIKTFILSHGGDSRDVEDILHDIYIILSDKKWQRKLIKDIIKPEYIMTACRNLWLKELERREVFNDLYPDLYYYTNENDMTLITLQQKRYEIFWDNYNRMSYECREIINASMKGIQSKTMAKRFGYSQTYYRKRKERCLKDLIKRIQQDCRLKELKYD
jgi:DNA-directed RNA polymerase specialized sigma24 family protein